MSEYEKMVTWQIIMSFWPCADWPRDRVRKAVPNPVPIIDFLKDKRIPAEDRVWVIVHTKFMTPDQCVVFAKACADHVEKYDNETYGFACSATHDANYFSTWGDRYPAAVARNARKAARCAAESAFDANFFACNAFDNARAARETEGTWQIETLISILSEK